MTELSTFIKYMLSIAAVAAKAQQEPERRWKERLFIKKMPHIYEETYTRMSRRVHPHKEYKYYLEASGPVSALKESTRLLPHCCWSRIWVTFPAVTQFTLVAEGRVLGREDIFEEAEAE